jgi:dimethylargininase
VSPRGLAPPALRVEQVERHLAEGLADLRDLVRDPLTDRLVLEAIDDDGSGVHGEAAVGPAWLTSVGCIASEVVVEIPDRQMGVDAADASDHCIGGHGSRSVLPARSHGYPARMTATARRYGAQSMTAELRDVLVKPPGAAFGRAYDDPANGYLHPVDLEVARREHDTFTDLLASLGPTVHILDVETDDPDLVYTFDPLLIADRGAVPLRPGKASRLGEPAVLEAWTTAAGIPTLDRIEPPGTIEGGDTFWLEPDLLCVGRTLRTNSSGVDQVARIVGGDIRVFDVPYWKGASELIHLLSVISPVADDLAVVFLPLLPVGLWELLEDLDIRLIPVPDEEFPTLGCNVLAVRPGVVILAEGNPATASALAAAGCEVHTYPASEIGINGSGGPTCMTRPILRG